MLCYTIGLLMMLRHVRTMNLPLRAARVRPFHALRQRLPPVATFGRTLSTKRHGVPSMMEAAVVNGQSEAEQHTFFNGKVATTVLAAEPPEPTTSVPPENAPARCIDTREEARRVVEVLMRHSTPDRVHAVDTEVMGLDLKKSPLGQGHVTCVSVYSGPDVDFGGGAGEALWFDTLDMENGVLDELKPWLEHAAALKVWHNYAFDRHVLFNHGVDAQGFGGDTMHMARLWDASRLSGYSLAVLTDELLVGRRKVTMMEIFGKPVLKKDGTPGTSYPLPSPYPYPYPYLYP
jgi:hypothetical protein